jgi:hypothetical protein
MEAETRRVVDETQPPKPPLAGPTEPITETETPWVSPDVLAAANGETVEMGKVLADEPHPDDSEDHENKE